MHGLHLTADLSGCPPDLPPMTDTGSLRSVCLAAVAKAGLGAVGELFHRFAPAPPGHEVPQTRHVPCGGGAAPAPYAGSAAPAPPAGITGVVLLAESHLAVHTWPEHGSVTIDVYVCNFGADNTARAHLLLGSLEAAFAPARVHRQRLQRGQPAVAS